MFRLLTIQDEVQKISEAIASVLNMDVIISDNEFNKIGDTKSHFGEEVKYIKDTYVIGKVIRNGDTEVVYGIEQYDNCSKCSEKEKCNLKAMICIPIKYGECTLGAIGIIATTETYRTNLLENQENLIEFLERMAKLIISKALEQEATNKLQVIKNQMVSIIDSIDEGIIVIDKNGYVIYTNTVIHKALNTTSQELKEKNIYEIIPQSYIKKLVNKKIQFSNNEVLINRNRCEFHALISSKTVKLEGKNTGFILILRKIEDIYKVVNKVSLSNLSITFDDIIGKSFEIDQTKEKAKKISNSNSTVLIRGESGTGKELFARAIHYSGNRKNKPFIAFNCAAIPESLLESELFGYEEGTFTGAVKGGKIGKFQLAQGGTIFLDEIGDIPIHLQTKLLRVLQEKRFEKVGGQKSIMLDVRIIAATNKELEKMIESGEYREDLYYRLSVIPIHIPPLRERTGDIEILLEFFLKQNNKKLNKNIKGFSESVKSLLLNNKWKGNVRELENIVEYAVNMESTHFITMNSIPLRVRKTQEVNLSHEKIMSIEKMEKKLIKEALMLYGDSVKEKGIVADVLGIGRATLYRKIKKYKLG